MGVAGLVLASLGANLTLSAASAAAEDCHLKRLGSADLTFSDKWGILLPVTINDHRATMKLDTAATTTMIRSGYLQPLGLSARSTPAHISHGNRMMTQIATPDSFTVGSQGISKPQFYVLPESGPPGANGAPQIGQLGMDVLGAADFELDFANNKLNFYSTDHCPGVVVYWTENYSSARITRGPMGNYFFPIELQGKKIDAVIATAVTDTWLASDVTRDLFGFDETSKDMGTTTDADGQPIPVYRAMALTGSGISIKNAQVRLITKKPSPACSLTSREGAAHYEHCWGAEAPLFLGLAVARRLHLYFATQEQVLYFSDAAATK